MPRTLTVDHFGGSVKIIFGKECLSGRDSAGFAFYTFGWECGSILCLPYVTEIQSQSQSQLQLANMSYVEAFQMFPTPISEAHKVNPGIISCLV